MVEVHIATAPAKVGPLDSLVAIAAGHGMDDDGAGPFEPTAFGLLDGAAIHTLANVIVSRHGGKHRKGSGSNPEERQPDASSGSGTAIAIGALIDGIPESVVIGVSLPRGGGSAW